MHVIILDIFKSFGLYRSIFISDHYLFLISKPPYLNTKVCCNACDCEKGLFPCMDNEDCEGENQLCLDGCCREQPTAVFEKGESNFTLIINSIYIFV